MTVNKKDTKSVNGKFYLTCSLLVGIVTVVITVILIILGRENKFLATAFATWGGLISFVLFNFYKRTNLQKTHLSEILPSDNIVLYLRQFDHDTDMAPITSSLSLADTSEQLISKLFIANYRFVAIGRPDEPIQTAGAERLYIDDTKWKNSVHDLMLQSKLIILRPENSEGVLWELKQICDEKICDKLIMFFPPDEKELESFTRIREVLQKEFSIEIPIEAFGSAFVSLDSNKKAIFDGRYKIFYGLGTELGRMKALIASIFNAPDKMGFRSFVQALTSFNPGSIIYSTEIYSHCRSRGIMVSQPPMNWIQKIVYYISIFCFPVLIISTVIIFINMLINLTQA